jgi:hypothetical protein
MTEAVKTLEPTSTRYKRGDTREDGKIFWGYNKQCRNGQQWVSINQFNKYKESIHNYNRSVLRKKVCKKHRETGLCKISSKKYRSSQKGKNRRNEYRYEKYHNDCLYKTKEGIRALLRMSFKKSGFSVHSKSQEILGCSFEFFKNYIEQRFKKGMTWKNRSEWHFDHIIPVSSAKTEKEIVKLNHYTNFRPLWAKENVAKGNKQTLQLQMSV